MRCGKCEKELHDCQCPWVKTYSGNKPNYTQPCERCGKVNPADVHTCTPKRGWVSLTNEEINQIYICAMSDMDLR